MTSDQEPLDISQAIDELRAAGFVTQAEPTYIHIEDAAHVLHRGILWYLGNRDETFRPVKFTDTDGTERSPYREVAEWLDNNKGKGLYLYGSCGLGKSMLACYVIPMILYYYNTPHKIVHVYSMTELNQVEKFQEALSKWIIVLDDVGCEEQMVTFGQRRNVFDELIDDAEKKGKLVIVTTNLTGREIEEKYGTRTFDRIKATMRRIRFELRDNNGNPISLRKYD